jgi:hypothetical protein
MIIKMALISENIALMFFAAILITAVIIAWWMETHENYDKGSFHTFIAVLAGLGVLVTFMFYYNLIQLQNQQQQLAAIQEAARISDSVLNSVLDEIKKASIIIPNFVLSITPLTNIVCCPETGTVCNIPVEPDPINPQTCTEKMVLSYRIFALWQDIITSCPSKFDQLAYVSNFLQRSNSQQLYAQWTAASLNFDSDTQAFGNLLFEYGLPITIQTPQEYTSVAQKLINDPRYKNIF